MIDSRTKTEVFNDGKLKDAWGVKLGRSEERIRSSPKKER